MMETKMNISLKEQQPDSRELILDIRDLHKSFGDNHVLNGFNMKLYKG